METESAFRPPRYTDETGRYQLLLEEFLGNPRPTGTSVHRAILENASGFYEQYHAAKRPTGVTIAVFPGSNGENFLRRYEELQQESVTRAYVGAGITEQVRSQLVGNMDFAIMANPGQSNAQQAAEEFEDFVRDNRGSLDILVERLLDAAVLNAWARASGFQVLNRDRTNLRKIRESREARGDAILDHVEALNPDTGLGAQAIVRVYARVRRELAVREAIATEAFGSIEGFSDDRPDGQFTRAARDMTAMVFDDLLTTSTITELADARERELREARPASVQTPGKRKRFECVVCSRAPGPDEDWELQACKGDACEQAASASVYCGSECQRVHWSGGHRDVCTGVQLADSV
jgi:hypothetical protein